MEKLNLALQRGDRAGQVDILHRLVELRAPIGQQWLRITYIAVGYGERGLARQTADLLVEALNGTPAALFQKAQLLTLIGDWADAYAILQSLPDHVPDPGANAHALGIAALNLGRRAEARDHLERATQLQPRNGQAWLALSMAADFSEEMDLADRLIANARLMEHTPLQQRAPYLYALGRTYAEWGLHRSAHDAFAAGARDMKATLPYDRAEDRASAEAAVDGYDANRIAQILRQQREPTGQTIFVNGLPRSGTTLVEQILTSHSTVGDGAETAWLLLLSQEIGGTSWAALDRYLQTRGPEHPARLWQHWAHELSAGRGRVVDKTTMNSRYLGLAAGLLPEAPLVWLVRDPLDRAWSCFRTNFSGASMPWSYDLEDIATHFRIEDGLLDRWQEILGERLLVLKYEQLATDPDGTIRRLLTHCGLAEEPQVFAPHENRRTVQTASMMQVRRPINSDAIGSAEPYREFLKPFLDVYYS
jgi:tetratricopeptide (TPR) repeat protein